MRVALVANRLADPRPTGVDRYHRELVRQLATRPGLVCTTLAAREAVEPDWVPPSVAHRYVPGSRRLTHLGWCTVGRPRIDRHARGADLVHVTVPSFPVPTRRPVVYTVHDLMPLEHPEWFPPLHRWGARRALEDVVARAAAVIANSRSTADALITRFPVDPSVVHVVPMGVGPAFLRPPDPAAVAAAAASLGLEVGGFAVALGQVNQRKDLPTVLQALARLDHPLPLVIAGGPGDGSAAVEGEIERLGLDRQVRMAGYVSDADLPALLAAARVLVHPSRFEGFGLPVLEAMAVGTPAIVAASGALPDTAADGAVVVQAGDPDGWAAALEALQDDDRRRTLADRGRAHAIRQTWERTADETVDVYRKVAAGG